MDSLGRFLFVSRILLLFLLVGCHGNRFMVGFMENKDSTIKALTIFIGRTDLSLQNPAFIKVKSLHSLNNPTLNTDYIVGPEGSVLVNIPVEYEVKGSGKTAQGISIESDQEIYIVGTNHVTVNTLSYTDGFLGIPVASLGFSYYPITKSDKAQILIVGVYDNTKVNIIGPKPFKYGVSTQKQLTETLNAFETIQLQALSSDLTGAHISSDKVVSVYSGNIYVDVGLTKNHLVQQVAPEHVWGYTYVTVPPSGATYNAIFVTGTDNTHVTSSCGHSFELTTSNNPSLSKDMGNNHCLFKSNNPVSVTMLVKFDGSDPDPSLIRMQPLQQVHRLVFFVTDTFSSKNLILISDVQNVLLDNTPVTTFSPVQGVAFYYSRSSVTKGRHIISCASNCSVSGYIHSFQGNGALGYPINPNQVDDHKATVATTTSAQSVDRSLMFDSSETTMPVTLDSYKHSTPLSTESSNSQTTYVSIVSTANNQATNTRSMDVSTPMGTTQWIGGSTTPNIINRTCGCRACSLVATNYSQEELESLVAELRQKLLVKREATTKYSRTLVSAPDYRTSATVVGYLAGTILVTLAVGLLIIDSPNLFHMVKTIKFNLSSPRATTVK